MAPREEEAPRLPDVFCERCGRMCDAQEVQTCPSCKKKFCSFCTYRIGSRDYCSRGCGDVFFFGGEIADEDEEEEPEE